MIIVPYKVIELKWIKNKGPQCFIDREEDNIPLIKECFSRFKMIQQSIVLEEEEQHSQSV